jgi:hypothetical protein
MPKLGQRKNDDVVPTNLMLPRATRAELEAAIGHKDIKTLTDAVIEAAKLLGKQVEKTRQRSKSG